MIHRRLEEELSHRLDEVPAVALVGPRQVGKTTLALSVAANRASVYLDLESGRDRAKIADPELYFSRHNDRLIVLDEVHRVPEIFQSLRGIIDRGRREGRRTGLFLLLGSASMDLMRQSGESLAGRISYLELFPIDALEIPAAETTNLWTRGGFPESLLGRSDDASFRWRLDFIRTYIERDIPQLGPRIPAETLRRFWTMLAHQQASLLNAAHLARALGVDGKTVTKYLDLMVDLLLVRRLAPWHTNAGKRLVRSPKVYVRDSGVVHALLGLRNTEEVLSHPVAGGSWEGFVIETILSVAPAGTEASFYRSSAGAEIDLLLALPGGRLWAVEIKRSLAPKMEKGFYQAKADLRPERSFVVYPGEERYPIGEGIEVVSISQMGQILRGPELAIASG